MCAAVVNTNKKTDGEGDLDPSTNFAEWLQAKGAQQTLIQKLMQNKISIEILQEIDVQEINGMASDLQLSTLEKVTFRKIVKNLPNQILHTIVDPAERKAILDMQKKLKLIQVSMNNINATKKKIEDEIAKCTKSIVASYDNIADKLLKRKQTLLNELKQISDKKMKELDDKYAEMKKNSLSTSSHISNCHSAINKKIDLMAIDTRKDNILKTAKTVQDFEIIDQNNKLITDYNIDFVGDTDKVIKVINKFGHFQVIPVPILISLERKGGKVNVKWKLEKNDTDNKENEINKLKVEWTEIENKNDDNNDNDNDKLDDLKVDFDKNKIFDIDNIDDNNNDVDIDISKNGDYLIRLQAAINDRYSKYSNIKTIALRVPVAAKFAFTHCFAATISENGTRIKSNGTSCSWANVTSSTGWNSGKYTWQIQANALSDSRHEGFGVVTDFAKAAQNVAYYNVGKSVAYLSFAQEVYKNGSSVKTGLDKIKPGEIVTVILDCDNWKITFHLNDKDLGTYDLEPNQKYHPVVGMCGCAGYDFKLLQ